MNLVPLRSHHSRRFSTLSVAILVAPLLLGLCTATMVAQVPDSKDIPDSVDVVVGEVGAGAASPRAQRTPMVPPPTPLPYLSGRALFKDPLRTVATGVQGLLWSFGSVSSFGGTTALSPAALGTSSGPAGGGVTRDLSVQPTDPGTRFNPLYLTQLRAASFEELRGVDATLYSGADAERSLNIVAPEFDVEGSYLRVGYAGTPDGSSNVGVLFARNIDDDLSLSFDFQRTTSDDVVSREIGGSLLGGSFVLDYYPSEKTKLRLSTGIDEYDRKDDGGRDDLGQQLYTGLSEEGRRRGVAIELLHFPERTHGSVLHDRNDTLDHAELVQSRSDEQYLQVSARYDHESRTLRGIPPRPDSVESLVRRADLVMVLGNVVQPLTGKGYLRGHAEAIVRNGTLGRVHAAALLGLGVGGLKLEAGGAVTSARVPTLEETVEWPVVLAAIAGEVGEVEWRMDGRFFLGGAESRATIVSPALDATGSDFFRSNWIVEGLVEYQTEPIDLFGDLSIRRVSSAAGGEVMGVDATVGVHLPIGPIHVSEQFGIRSDYGVSNLRSLLVNQTNLSWPFALLNGALEVEAGVGLEWRGEGGGFRYDPVQDLWYSSSEIRDNAISLNPLLSSSIAARIGSAFFTFELVNILNNTYWTTRGRNVSGIGLQFGLDWVLID